MAVHANSFLGLLQCVKRLFFLLLCCGCSLRVQEQHNNISAPHRQKTHNHMKPRKSHVVTTGLQIDYVAMKKCLQCFHVHRPHTMLSTTLHHQSANGHLCQHNVVS